MVCFVIAAHQSLHGDVILFSLSMRTCLLSKIWLLTEIAIEAATS